MMLEVLLFPFQFPFMAKAFTIVLILSPAAALLSCFLILRGWALIGDAISHGALPGIVFAYLGGLPLIFGAFASGFTCAVLSGFLAKNGRLKADTVMGVVFSGMFALGIVIYTKVEADIDLIHILFGNMLGVSTWDIIFSGAISATVVLIIFLKRLDLLLYCFDPVQGHVMGLNTNLLHYGLLIMLSFTVVNALATVGIILSIGLLIIPGATAFIITKHFNKMLLLATLITLLSGFFGVYVSFFLDSAPEPTVILLSSLIFLLAMIVKSFRSNKNSKTL